MSKLWTTEAAPANDSAVESFNSSLAFDARLYRQDILASEAHAAMLTGQGILSPEDGEAIQQGLAAILDELEAGKLLIDPTAEDIHTFVEAELTARIGDAGRGLHTARSRNDQVATDLRLWLREENLVLQAKLLDLLGVLADQAEVHVGTVMPGYTHLQRAQPVTLAHHLLAYAMMFGRDLERLRESAVRINVCPLGSGALAGTTYPIDRAHTALLLGFSDISKNSLDAVSDRDFVVESLSDLSLIMMHLSRFAEELILWSSYEFRFIQLGKAYTTGSSIMPQKVNPDICELVRGKTGRVYGHLFSLLTTLKALPLAYNKDLQEDKEALFDAVDTVKASLTVFIPLLRSLTVNRERLRQAAGEGFLNATDLADYLTKKGLPFRSSYHLIAELVRHCSERGLTLEELPLADYRTFSDLFEDDLYEALQLENVVNRRLATGGPAAASLAAQLAFVRSLLDPS